MNPLKKAYNIVRFLGPGFVARRVMMRAAHAIGSDRKAYSPNRWEDIELKSILRPGVPDTAEEYRRFKLGQDDKLLFPIGDPPSWRAVCAENPLRGGGSSTRAQALAERLSLLADDRCVYFFHQPSPEPIDWYHNPFEDTRGTADRRWDEIGDFSSSAGDARTLWEPARAGWAIDLMRADSHGVAIHDSRGNSVDAAELFWRWTESWLTACPPFMGFHWKCGQESSVRLLALTLAFRALASRPASGPERFVHMAKLAWVTGRRIIRHIDYAVSQKNNHATSEAMGLMLIGQAFPELAEAAAWRTTGRRVLERELRRQIYEDGSYLQHSMNYQRVMMQGGLVGMRLAELAGDPMPRDVYGMMDRCADFLHQMMEPANGRLPNYGANDSAWMLPLSECDFRDYRPLIQSVHYLANRKRLFEAGPWDEDLLWLWGGGFARSAKADPPVQSSSAFDRGGYYTLRGLDSWAMIRCHTYRDRPNQIDHLHLDLWRRGRNLLCDSGSYRYFDARSPASEAYFKSSPAHNTMTLDGVEPMESVGRFLWLPWPRAKERHFEAGDSLLYFEGESLAYDRSPWNVLHRRSVIGLDDGTWVVVDDLIGEGSHAAALHWHMTEAPCTHLAEMGGCRLDTADGPLGLAIATNHPSGVATRLERGVDEPDRVQGFASEYYGCRVPIPVLTATFSGRLPLRLVTCIGSSEPRPARATESNDSCETWIVADGGAQRAVVLEKPARGTKRTLVEIRNHDE